MNEITKPITSLKPADYNPRTISAQKQEALGSSITDFGDLSCIVNNITTGNLVGGHQRIADMMKRPEAHIEYTQRLDQPDALGTMALGYVVVTGTAIKLAYREVAWDEVKEKQANIIANYAQGEFVMPLLAAATASLHQLGEDVALKTGQRKEEITKLLKSLEKSQPQEPQEILPPDSEAHATYRIGHHTITAGEHDLEFVDRVRREYAESQNRGEDWETYCGRTGFVPHVPEAQPTIMPEPIHEAPNPII